MGSGKGYLSSFLSLQYGFRVFGIDSSSTNTHGAQERNRKLKKFSRAYQKRGKSARAWNEATHSHQEELIEIRPGLIRGDDLSYDGEAGVASKENEMVLSSLSDINVEANAETETLFLSALSEDLVQTTSPRLPPSQLSTEEKERRKRENLERKAQRRTNNSSPVFSPLMSYVTPETELRELIGELEVRKFKADFFLQQLEFALLEEGVPNLQSVIINKFCHRSAPLPLPTDSPCSFHSFLCMLSPNSRKRSWSGCTHVETWHPAPCGCL